MINTGNHGDKIVSRTSLASSGFTHLARTSLASSGFTHLARTSLASSGFTHLARTSLASSGFTHLARTKPTFQNPNYRRDLMTGHTDRRPGLLSPSTLLFPRRILFLSEDSHWVFHWATRKLLSHPILRIIASPAVSNKSYRHSHYPSRFAQPNGIAYTQQ